MIGIVVGFLVGTVFSAACLWAGMKLTKVDGSFLGMFLIAAISSLVGFIPWVGWLVSLIVMFVLISKWTDAEFWPDAVLMIIVASFVGAIASLLLTGLLANT